MFPTKYLFVNAKFRSDLIDNILNGNIIIDQHVCNCIYKVIIIDNGEKEFISNFNGKDEPCDYKTILYNLDYGLYYLGIGASGFVAQVQSRNDYRLKYALKIIMYENFEEFGEIDNPNRAENLEVTILKILNQRILLPKISPHIILYIQDFRCSGIPVLWAKDKSSKFELYLRRLDDQYYMDHSIVLISELAEFGSLEDILNKNKLSEFDLTVIYFQFIYTLAQIQRIIPGFRHNDMYLSNILVQEDKNYERNKYYVYYYQSRYYFVPVTPIQIKFWDFETSNIIGETRNVREFVMTAEEDGYRHTYNNYYDLHLFTNMLLVKIKEEKKPRGINIDNSELVKLFEIVVPIEYYGLNTENTSGGRLLPDIEYITPDKLLQTRNYVSGMFKKDLADIYSNFVKDHVVDAFGVDLGYVKELVKDNIDPRATIDY